MIFLEICLFFITKDKRNVCWTCFDWFHRESKVPLCFLWNRLIHTHHFIIVIQMSLAGSDSRVHWLFLICHSDMVQHNHECERTRESHQMTVRYHFWKKLEYIYSYPATEVTLIFNIRNPWAPHHVSWNLGFHTDSRSSNWKHCMFVDVRSNGLWSPILVLLASDARTCIGTQISQCDHHGCSISHKSAQFYGSIRYRW